MPGRRLIIWSFSEYQSTLNDLCRLYDRAVGIKGALFGDAVARNIEAPVFRLGQYSENGLHVHGSAGDPARGTLESRAAFAQAMDRLAADPDSDLSGLI